MWDRYTNTQRVIAEMLTENTGRHLLDSGDYYGRHWQQNQGGGFLAEEATSLTFRWGFVEVVHNLFHWLDSALEYDEALDEAFTAWCDKEENERLAWLACPEPFLEHLRELGAEVAGIYGDGEPFTHNTNNGEDLLSQTIQFTFARIQLRDGVTCLSCGLCARTDRQVIVGFLPHGSQARAAQIVASGVRRRFNGNRRAIA